MASILLIEPDRLLANIYCQALEKAGHKVSVVAGAQAGVMVADKIRPDLVILELQLVEHSGIEFLYEFRSYADWQNIPVIIQSQVPVYEFNDAQPILKTQLNVTDYLYKPQTNLKQLIQVVNDQLPVAV